MICNQLRELYDMGDEITDSKPRAEYFPCTHESILKINDDGK